MSLTGHRVESIRVERLNRAEESLGDLDGISGGSLTWEASADLPAGGNLTLVEIGQTINYSSDRVRIWWSVQGVEEWPLGVYVLAAPTESHTDAEVTRSIALIDKLTVIREDVITETLQIAKDANIVAAAVDLVKATGETRISATASSKTLTNAMTWDPGTSRLQIVNDLLATAGYAALWTDRNGMFRVEPFIEPAQRPVVWDFTEGEASIHSPNWEYELSLWEASNKVVMTSQANDAGTVFLASAVDTNPASPTSTVSMGRTLNPIVVENVEAASQADLESQALRRLLDTSNVAGKVRVSHAPVPIWFNDAVTFTSGGREMRAAVSRMSLELRPGALVSAEWRETP